MLKRKQAKPAVKFSERPQDSSTHSSANPRKLDLVIAARMSRELGISPVTFWRWRRSLGFPPGTRINRRVYFSRSAIRDWLDRQQRAA